MPNAVQPFRTARIVADRTIIRSRGRLLESWRFRGFLQFQPIAVGDQVLVFKTEASESLPPQLDSSMCIHDARLIRIRHSTDPVWVTFETVTSRGDLSILLVPSAFVRLSFRDKVKRILWTGYFPPKSHPVHVFVDPGQLQLAVYCDNATWDTDRDSFHSTSVGSESVAA